MRARFGMALAFFGLLLIVPVSAAAAATTPQANCAAFVVSGNPRSANGCDVDIPIDRPGCPLRT